ncbi:glycosyltransferase family 2 protein [Natronococcus sp. A-GB1]|uniref:glycosyltransferase n=1 Tax=Natronococcus sp. A-GB1 TaxID=3037648 RepID=UPI00241DC7D1|nr:glycosyltransferase family 2 protein [Natronococcus sp. A-GB1]MDG5761228.1 glycosyltransferase family 2 protein [Natronococcus sp. A-GB1]
MERARAYVLVWHAAIVAALVGVVGLGLDLGQHLGSVVLATAGSGVLAAFVLAAAWRKSRRTVDRRWDGIVPVAVGGVALVAAATTGLGLYSLPLSERVVVLATSAQVFLLAVDRYSADTAHNTRWRMLAVGHGAIVAGSALELGLLGFRPGAALLLYATGFSLLLLHAFWMFQLDSSVVPPQPNTGPRHSEAILLSALIAGNIGVIAASFSIAVVLAVPTTRLAQVASIVAGIAAVVAFGMLVAPPSPPSRLDPLTGVIATVFQHAGIAIVMLNLIVIAVFFAFPGAFFLMLGLYLLLLAVGVGIEYLQVAYAHRHSRSNEDAPSLPEDLPVTVVVTAAFEADVLPESLEHNLEALDGMQFILVPAAKSTDGTVEIAREFRDRYPDRVRVVEGTTGSKAGDLTHAWKSIDTPYGLILDADERIEAEFVARGLRMLRENPQLGAVQGRKAAANPDADALARFVSAERRYSTWVDHPFMDEILGAGHFGGSSAIFRREVPPEVDGWRSEVLTEDIDLTLRLYLETEWLVGYDARMVSRESNPASFRALVRQRIRWARGWIQVASYHGGAILRSRERFGLGRTLGLSWLLFTAVSAPASVVFPAFMLLWFAGLAPALPVGLSLLFALYLLPARAVSFGYASLRDPALAETVGRGRGVTPRLPLDPVRLVRPAPRALPAVCRRAAGVAHNPKEEREIPHGSPRIR